MTEPRRVSREEWLAEQRQQWQASGSPLEFDEWQQQEANRRAAELDTKRNAEIQADVHRVRVERLEGMIPARYRSAETNDGQLVKWADRLIAGDLNGERTGPSVLIVGQTGTGKTHAAFGAIRRYVHGGGIRLVTPVTVADLYARLRPHPASNSEDAFARYANTPVLLLDDLAAAKSSEWTDEVNYRLLNHRYNAALPTLITSNVPPSRLHEVVGDRVASRLAEMCEHVTLKGEDRRRARGAA